MPARFFAFGSAPASMSASIASTSSLLATARSLQVQLRHDVLRAPGPYRSARQDRAHLQEGDRVGPRARPLCLQRWVSATASSTARSEAKRRSQSHLVGAFAGITCLARRLESDHHIGTQLPAGAGAHRAGPGIAQRHACVGREHAAVARKADSVARVHRELARRFELVVRPEPACIVRGPEPLGGAPGGLRGRTIFLS